MIFDGSTLPLPLRITADLCVIGSGAGGAMVAMLAAEAGLRVVVLEAGGFVPPSAMNQREEAMLPRLFVASGATTTANRAVRVLQGKGIGGSTLHNLNLCKRIPDAVFAQWRADGNAEIGALAELYPEVERLLSVSDVPEALWNRHNRLLQQATTALRWSGGGLRHNRSGCVGSGFCALGCSFDAKNNAAKVLVPRAVTAGASFITGATVIEIQRQRQRVRGVRAVLRGADATVRGELYVAAPRVCVSASATESAALLLRSAIPDASEKTGKTLHLHPALVVAGEFVERVEAWRGIPQTFECTEWLDFSSDSQKRVWIVPAFAHPIGAATLAPGHGLEHARFMSRYPHLAVLSAMIHDETPGTVRVATGSATTTLDYWPNAADRAQLALGAWAAAKLLFGAGAQRVIVPCEPPIVIERGASYDGLRALPIEPGRFTLTSTHPQGSIALHDDPKRGVVDSFGRHHTVAGLWVADASVFPSSIGVPPQLSTYAFGMRAGRTLVKAG